MCHVNGEGWWPAYCSVCQCVCGGGGGGGMLVWGERKLKKGKKRHKAADGGKNRRTGSGGRWRERFGEVMSLPWQRASHAQSHHQQSQIHLCLIGAGSLARLRVRSPSAGRSAALLQPPNV